MYSVLEEERVWMCWSYPVKASPAPHCPPPQPPAISLIITDLNQMDSGAMLTTELEKFHISRVWMPTKSKPSRQPKGRQPSPASAKSFVSPFPPRAVRRWWWLRGSVRPHLGASLHAPIILRKSAHHLYMKSTGGGLWGRRGAKRSKTHWLIANPAMMSAWINASHRHANQLHDIITASITPVGLQSYSKDNITQHLKPQETSTALLDVL